MFLPGEEYMGRVFFCPRVVVIPTVLSNLNIFITIFSPLPHLIRFMFPLSLSLAL
jgi:hypothetical protein